MSKLTLITVLLLGLSCTSAIYVPQSFRAHAASNQAKLQNFIEYFLTGLQVNPAEPGACYTSLISITNSIFTILNDAESALTFDAIQKLYQDFQGVMNNLEKEQESCNFEPLFAQLGKLSTLEGWQMVLQNYIANKAAINQHIQECESCWCTSPPCYGDGCGGAFSLLIGWKLQ